MVTQCADERPVSRGRTAHGPPHRTRGMTTTVVVGSMRDVETLFRLQHDFARISADLWAKGRPGPFAKMMAFGRLGSKVKRPPRCFVYSAWR